MVQLEGPNEEPNEPETESEEYYSVPEEAFGLLPAEWRDALQEKAESGRAILKSVDPELSQLSRVSNSLMTLAALKYVRDRLSEYRFAANLNAFLELEMLTTAFVVTYVRLQRGEHGSGFSRDALPDKFRKFHDQIIDLRNKRFAHTTDHHTISDAMEIGLMDDKFEINMSISLRYQIGGATEWQEMVDFLDALYAERCEKLLARLREKTGHEWALSTGPQPTDSTSSKQTAETPRE